MENNKKLELDPGFEEVHLDEGFQEVPLEAQVPAPSVAPSDVSTLQDFGEYLLHGSQVGGSDELSGLGSAIGTKVADSDAFQKMANWYYGQKMGASPEAIQIADEAQKSPEKTFYEAYRKGQEDKQKDLDETKKRSPIATGVGQMVGGVLTGIATGGLSKVAPVLTGIGAGSLSGALGSEANIENPVQLAKDTAFGGALGGIFGKILPSGGAKKTEEAAQDILNQGEFLPQIKAAAKMGREGISLSNKPSARQVLTQRLQENEKGIADQFIKPRKELGKAVGDSLKGTEEDFLEKVLQQKLVDAEKGGSEIEINAFKKLLRNAQETRPKSEGMVLNQTLDDLSAVKNVEDLLVSNSKAIGQGKAAELAQKAQNMQQGFLNPQEAYLFRKELSDISSKIADPQQQQILRTGLETIQDVLGKSTPGFKEASKDFAQFAQKGPEALLSKGFDPEIADVFLGDMSKGNLKISEKVRDLLTNIRSGGENGLKKQGELFSTINQLEQLAQENPELVKKLGIDPKNLLKEFINKADEAAVAGKVSGEGLGQAVVEHGKFGLRRASEAGVLKAANMYGGAKKYLAEDFARGTRDQMSQFANTLRNNGGEEVAHIAEALVSEVPHKRNAAVFSILQSPKLKDMLGISAEKDDK